MINETFLQLKNNVLGLTESGYNYAQDNLGPFFETFIAKSLVLFETIKQSEVLYLLLGFTLLFGTINWTVWFIRRTRSIRYKPVYGSYSTSTSVVIPVYKEQKNVLKRTIDSIIENKPDEIILVLDHTETEMMNFLNKEYGQKYEQKIQTHYIVEPGKRQALAKGISLAKGEIVVLVDSDTEWVGKDFLKNLLAPFNDPKVGGVGTRQRVKDIRSWGQRIIDWVLDLKYTDYVRSDSLSGSVLCLSGRTAAYRRKILLPVLDKLTKEYFLWHRCQGGDDARLTTLVLKQGYNTVYQDNCIAETLFDPSFSVYLRQKIRWSRNSFRTYIKSVFSLWPWRQRRAYYLMAAYHTLVPGLTFLLGISFFVYSIIIEVYILAYIWLAWAFVSRLIKSFSHLRKKPTDTVLLPALVSYYILLSFIKLYALFTMTRESWSGSRENYRIKNGVRVGG